MIQFSATSFSGSTPTNHHPPQVPMLHNNSPELLSEISDNSPLNVPLTFATADNRHTSTTKKKSLFTAANELQLSTTQSPLVLLLAVPARLRDKIINAPLIQKNSTKGPPQHILQQAFIAASCSVAIIVLPSQLDARTNLV